MQRSLQNKESLSSVVIMDLMQWQQLLATTVLDGADLMTFKQLGKTIVRSLMVTKFTLLADLDYSELTIPV